jgi:hypothetical protein
LLISGDEQAKLGFLFAGFSHQFTRFKLRKVGSKEKLILLAIITLGRSIGKVRAVFLVRSILTERESMR